MKKISILIAATLLIACGTEIQQETGTSPDMQTTSSAQPDSPSPSSADYSALLLDYECDMNEAALAELLDIPVADLELQSYSSAELCIFRYSRNGTYESNITLGKVQATKAGNKKAITKALKNKERNRAVLGNDIALAATGDSYLEYIPIQGRIYIRNENYDGAFQLFYGSKARRTQEQHDEMKEKMTALANHLLEKYKR